MISFARRLVIGGVGIVVIFNSIVAHNQWGLFFGHSYYNATDHKDLTAYRVVNFLHVILVLGSKF